MSLASLKASAVEFFVAAENICTDCSVTVKQNLDRSPLARAARPDLKRMAIVMAHDSLYRGDEARIFKYIKDDYVAVTPFGRSLLAKADNSQAIDYRIFYQYGLDANGYTSLLYKGAEAGYEVDQRDPHELYGFFRSVGGVGTVFMNEYQRPEVAQYTLVHELSHLFDEKTGLYIEQQKQSGEWTDLDQLAVEFRSLLAEATHLAERAKLKSDRVQQPPTHMRGILSWRGKIDIERLADTTLELFFPKSPASFPVLSLDEDAPAYDLRYLRNSSTPALTTWKLSSEITAPNVHEAVSRFVMESVDRCSVRSCPTFSVAILNYRSIPLEQLRQASEEGRAHLNKLLQARGARSFLDYLEKRGLLSDSGSELKFRASGLNEFFHSSGGPAPRLTGGSFRTMDKLEK